jgi:hypothetical protein
MNEMNGPQTRLYGAAAIAAPVLLLASTAAYAAGGGLGEDQLGGTIQVYAMAAFGLALFGLSRLVEPAMPRGAAVLAVLAALGAAGGVGYGIDSLHGGVHAGAALDETALGPLALQLPGLLFPVSLIVAGVALARSGAAPLWTGIVLALGGVLFPASRIPSVETLALVSDLLILVALVPVGWRILGGASAPLPARMRAGAPGLSR